MVLRPRYSTRNRSIVQRYSPKAGQAGDFTVGSKRRRSIAEQVQPPSLCGGTGAEFGMQHRWKRCSFLQPTLELAPSLADSRLRWRVAVLGPAGATSERSSGEAKCESFKQLRLPLACAGGRGGRGGRSQSGRGRGRGGFGGGGRGPAQIPSARPEQSAGPALRAWHRRRHAQASRVRIISTPYVLSETLASLLHGRWQK